MNKVLKKALILFSIVIALFIEYAKIKVFIGIGQCCVALWQYGLEDEEISKIVAQEQEARAIKNKEWLGDYEFIEDVSDDYTIKYSIKIHEDPWKELYADILITKSNGNIMYIVSDANIESDTLTFVFYEFLQEGINTEFEDGQRLLSFEKKDNELLTYWGAITPELEENTLDGQVYFVKVGD